MIKNLKIIIKYTWNDNFLERVKPENFMFIVMSFAIKNGQTPPLQDGFTMIIMDFMAMSPVNTLDTHVLY